MSSENAGAQRRYERLGMRPTFTVDIFERAIADVENSKIADRLDAFAALLELAEANPYTARAYRRAAQTIRDAALPVDELVRRRARAS